MTKPLEELCLSTMETSELPTALSVLTKHGLDLIVQKDIDSQATKGRAATKLPDCEAKSPASTKSFELPANPQELSRLVQLPPEIKLMIFALLHKLPKPIEPQSPFLPNDIPHRYNTQMSSQLFRTCQTLFLEASDVLYRENSLVINCTHTLLRWGGHQCDILNTSTPLPRSLFAPAVARPNLLSYARKSRTLRTKGHISDHSFRSLEKYYPSLPRFTKVHLRLRLSDGNSMMMACRLVRDLLMGPGRKITVSLIIPDRDSPLDWLGCLKWLRCSTIQVNVNGAERHDLSDVVSIVQSKKQVPDLLPFYVDLSRFLENHFGECYPHGLLGTTYDEFEDATEALDVALYNNDPESFVLQKNLIIVKAIEESEKAMKWRPQE